MTNIISFHIVTAYDFIMSIKHYLHQTLLGNTPAYWHSKHNTEDKNTAQLVLNALLITKHTYVNTSLLKRQLHLFNRLCKNRQGNIQLSTCKKKNCFFSLPLQLLLQRTFTLWFNSHNVIIQKLRTTYFNNNNKYCCCNK